MRLTAWRTGVAALAVAITLAGSLIATPSPAAAQQGLGSSATVYFWNDTLLEVFRRQGGGPGPLARGAAMMHAGIFDTFNTADWWSRQWVGTGFDFYSTLPDPSPDYGGYDWAAGRVASELLKDAFPAHSTFIEQQFVNRHGTTPPQFAQNVVNQILPAVRARRANDGSTNTTPYQFQNTPGAWRLTGTMCNTPTGPTGPTDPNWGRVRPFSASPITNFTQDSPGGFPSYQTLLASGLYASQLNEVKSLGRFNSTARTPLQTQIAWFWANDLNGTYKPPGQLLDHTRIVTQQRGITRGLDVARVFARVSIAMADAGIAAWFQKFDTSIDLWRPQTAIALADTDGNPDTVADPLWLPLSANQSEQRFSPCFPAWVSGHATFGAAWAGVMRNMFGDNANNVVLTTQDPHAVGVTRTFATYTAAAVENARSRIYLGVHFQFDADDGLATGFGIANHVTANELGALACNGTPPQVCW
jgi:hypothetical protein